MSDIFISYSRADRDRAQRLARALGELGFQVWWDRKIPPGKTFDQVIQEALDASDCVVVLWSETSVASDWVKEEAQAGLAKGALVPVLIDDVPIPLGFGRIQTANLVGWNGDPGHPELDQLARSVAVYLFARVRSPESESLKLEWRDGAGRVLSSETIQVGRNTDPGYRIGMDPTPRRQNIRQGIGDSHH